MNTPRIAYLTVMSLLMLFPTTGWASNMVVFQQPPIAAPSPQPAIVKHRSQKDPGFFFDRAYDNFTFSNPTIIRELHWSGAYTTDPGQAATPEPISFTVSFWESRPGAMFTEPDTSMPPIYSFSTMGNANEGNPRLEFGPGFDTSFSRDYWFELPTSLEVEAGQETWVSIVADLESPDFDDPFWGWHVGLGGESASYQDWDIEPNGILLDAEGRALLNSDFAMTLKGSTVPAPSTLAGLLSLVACGCWRSISRRRKRRSGE